MIRKIRLSDVYSNDSHPMRWYIMFNSFRVDSEMLWIRV